MNYPGSRPTRAEMYSFWGKKPEEWTGIYPNPDKIEDQFKTEMALIYRAGSKSHIQASWGSFDFVSYSDTKFHSFRGTASVAEIMNTHIKSAQNRAMTKFGATGNEVVKKLGLANLAGDGAKKIEEGLNDLLTPSEAYEVAKDAYSSINKKIMLSSLEDFIGETTKDVDMKIAKAQEAVSQIRVLTSKIQGIFDALANINGIPGEIVKDPEPRIVGGVRLDKSSYTAAKNILALMDDMNKIADDIEKNPMKVPSSVIKSRKTIKLKKYSVGPSGSYESKVIEQDFSKIFRAMSGTLANLTGGIFEIAYASAIANTMQDIYSSVEMLGAGASTGSANAPLGRVQFGTSKTDLQLKARKIQDVSDVTINISAKGQKTAKSTKLHDSNIDSVMQLISKTEFQKNMLQIGFANPLMWERGTEMNRFISALMADVATAGLAGDKIDLIAYSDSVITIEDFYRKIGDSIYFSGARGGNLGGFANSVITTGTSKIIFSS